jgi:hypothetical protein
MFTEAELRVAIILMLRAEMKGEEARLVAKTLDKFEAVANALASKEDEDGNDA